MGKVDDLARQGKANADAAVALERAAAAAKARDEALERDRGRWAALSPFGFVTGSLGWYFAMLAVFFPLTVLNILVLVELRVSDTVAMIVMPGHGRLYLPIPALLLTFAFVWYARRAVRRAVAREQAWLDRLPFRVTGYLECLGSYYRDNESEISLTFDFAGERPARLDEILASDGGTWNVDGAQATRHPGPRTSFKVENNKKVVWWFHQLVQNQLLPLHAEYPFRGVSVTNSDSYFRHHPEAANDA